MRRCIGEREREMPGEIESGQMLAEWNDARAGYPRSAAIHWLFEQQAALTPHAVAIEFEDRTLTYGELNAQANRVATRLRRKGILRGTLVGLCLERSPEVIVGMLAILKAGGAYVPLDPDYPDNRLSFMLRDTCTPRDRGPHVQPRAGLHPLSTRPKLSGSIGTTPRSMTSPRPISKSVRPPTISLTSCTLRARPVRRRES